MGLRFRPQSSSHSQRSGALSTGHHHLTTLNRMERPRIRSRLQSVCSQKCRESGQFKYRALLDWRNTPTEGIGTSPAQRFFGRRCNTLLPMTHSQLEPQYSTADDARILQCQKAKQQHYYDRRAKDLPPIHKGDVVRKRLPGQTTWTPAVCMGPCCPRSYRVKVDGREF